MKFDGRVASTICRADHESILIKAVTDKLSDGYVFGLDNEGTIFVFKTSNLLVTPEATECILETKIKVNTLKSEVYFIGFKSVKGGLVVSMSDGNNLFYNTTSLMN